MFDFISDLKNQITEFCKNKLGFELTGFTNAIIDQSAKESYLNWINKGYSANMTYMSNNIDIRFNPELLLENYKSMIVVGLNYYQNTEADFGENISIYSYGKDYHKVIKKKLKKLQEFLKNNNINSRCFVDSAPVWEKYFAVKAGLGWIGKNSLLINREIGSFFFIGVVLTDFDFGETEPINHSCKKCRKCIENCPTNAITEEKTIDCTKCISYLTIENNEIISDELKQKFGKYVFGCDICQKVCPFNKEAKLTNVDEFKFKYKTLNISNLINFTEEEFKSFFEGTPIRRATFNVFIDLLKKNS